MNDSEKAGTCRPVPAHFSSTSGSAPTHIALIQIIEWRRPMTQIPIVESAVQTGVQTSGLTSKGSDIFVRALENEGVKYIFGVPGEENLDLVESLSKSSIRLIVTRHEQVAGFMAA